MKTAGDDVYAMEVATFMGGRSLVELKGIGGLHEISEPDGG